MPIIKLNSSAVQVPGTKSGEGNGVVYFLLACAAAFGLYHFVIKPEMKKAEEEKKKAEGK